ncbi:sensor histidine kinase [Dyadobacter sp. CY343]|uniref:sensor histidine kinase n=1 Tax=Dyadobacter sp. CY343 TaxID=2907299 RepID=UPI001F43E23C|nr:sensor histidine kinase [Dyadobacter sp. CY343]MCE7060852.1 sensor histidine kinase [Dyadobacter sp. CY343]
MKEPPYKFDDRKMRLIGIPLGGILIPMMINFDGFMKLSADFGISVLFSTFITLILWEGNRAIIMRMWQKFPDHNQTTRRVLYESALGLLYVLIISIILNETICKPYFKHNAFLITFRISIVPTIIVYLIYESVYFFESWKMNVRKTESLMREGVQSQLEVLKNQLDPHFLFNSMNTLAALIDDENTDAQDYLERLSDVYRYVLVSRSKNTVTVEEEIAFVDAYVYLNKIRFRDNLQVTKQLSAGTMKQHVTPLSLQMLIENAIKHNVASRKHPLTITISDERDDYLVIENNISEKTILEKSTRVGLQNIINRYSLLSERQVEIIRKNELFTVKIPLLGQVV